MTFIEAVIALANRKVAQAEQAGDTSQAKRIASACEIVLDDLVAPLGGGLYWVASRSKPYLTYSVVLGSCECADFNYRAVEGILCAHQVAIELYEEANRLARTATDQKGQGHCASGPGIQEPTGL